MAALTRIPPFMNIEEFLNWDAPGPTRWQLIDGVPVAMSPNTGPHGAIQSELSRRIGNHLIEANSPCTAITTPGVVPAVRSDRNFMIPDLGVTCAEDDVAGKIVNRPVLMVEILSPSNPKDTWRNIRAYQTMPSVMEILVVRTASVGVDLLRRNDDATWPEQPIPITEGDFTLASIGLTVPLAALYRRTGIAAAN
jgi:Uma2 family endonuclease